MAKLENPDAIARLDALNAPNPAVMSLQEHESRITILSSASVLRKIRSDRASVSDLNEGARNRTVFGSRQTEQRKLRLGQSLVKA